MVERTERGEMMNDEEKAMLMAIHANAVAEHRATEIRRMLKVIGDIPAMVDDMPKVEYTGSYACFHEQDGKWTFQGIVTEDDESLPEFSVILPLPKPETLGEWDGF